ncbi:DUF4365 domain-containing protein [Pseudoalteromonas peptidolytica]|uniref:DUF4365 domain-containing protein n=1 Tax=Pseudoalteromonas peptidolytica TaxID=61150 RepID=UPI00298DF9B6|nr:DUF4365 and DUF1817 domain-containing protein [Pseudoalteromonas peptidolytica]MDW7549824.1 DUF4365 and DUF1817 domain-containing protein [Pseudoalteromonas peptidolytica]
MLGPKYSGSAKKGELGVQRVSNIIFENFGWIFKKTPQEFDFGIDGQVELVDDDGVVTGQTFAVQIKYGRSFFKDRSRWGYIYRGELKHVNYLINYPLPVFIMLCDPDSNDVYWEVFDAARTDRTPSAWKMSIPKGQVLASSKETIRSLLPEVMDYTEELENYWLINDVITKHTNSFHIVISKDWVESGDISEVVSSFDRLQVSRELAFKNKSNVEISFFGYESDPRELFEIPEVVSYAKKLAERLSLFFYCEPSSNSCGLMMIALCCANAKSINSIKPQARVDKHAFIQFLHQQYALLNKVTDWLEMTEAEIEEICLPIHELLGID